MLIRRLWGLIGLLAGAFARDETSDVKSIPVALLTFPLVVLILI